MIAALLKKKNTKQKGGFTLIELLIVVAIIGILASVILLSLSGARTRAQASRAASDLAQMSKLFALYLEFNNTHPCFDHIWDDTREQAWAAPYYAWPKTPWGAEYHWEHGVGFTYSISIRSPGDTNAQALDSIIDDGNLSTGLLRGNGGRLEYGGMDQNVPLNHCHI